MTNYLFHHLLKVFAVLFALLLLSSNTFANGVGIKFSPSVFTEYSDQYVGVTKFYGLQPTKRVDELSSNKPNIKEYVKHLKIINKGNQKAIAQIDTLVKFQKVVHFAHSLGKPLLISHLELLRLFENYHENQMNINNVMATIDRMNVEYVQAHKPHNSLHQSYKTMDNLTKIVDTLNRQLAFIVEDIDKDGLPIIKSNYAK